MTAELPASPACIEPGTTPAASKTCRVCARTKPLTEFPVSHVYRSKIYYEQFQAQTVYRGPYCIPCRKALDHLRYRRRSGAAITQEDVQALYPTLEAAPLWLQDTVRSRVAMKKKRPAGSAS